MRGKLFIGLAVLGILGFLHPAKAQADGKIRRIGFLSVYSQSDPGSQTWHKAFERGLRDLGWVVGKNITIAHRWIRDRRKCMAMGRRACTPGLIDELLGLKVELIVVHGGFPARAIRKKNRTIPVVMAEASDAVGRGIIKSLARPGGNITGLTSITPVLAAKRLEILREIVPSLARVAVIWTPEAPAGTYAWKQIQDPAHTLGLQLYSLKLPRSAKLSKAFDQAVKSGAQAFIGTSGVFTIFDKKDVLALIRKSRLPSIFTIRDAVLAGALLSYNRNTERLYYRAATYVDKILKGAKPADLPVEQPTEFDLVINLKTAKAQGITIPRSLLLRAGEVIE